MSIVFYKDAAAAINIKTENPEMILLISLESKFQDNNSFWNNDSILSILLPNRFIIVRLSASETHLEYTQFTSIYPTYSLPSIYVFGSYSQGPSHTWIGSYPTVEDFIQFFSSQSSNNYSTQQTSNNYSTQQTSNNYSTQQTSNNYSSQQTSNNYSTQKPSNPISTNIQNSSKPQANLLPKTLASNPPRKVSKVCKISLQTSQGSFQHDFLPNDTIQSLRNWVQEVLSLSQCPQLTVMHTRSLLTPNNDLTLSQADLFPSAVLRVEASQSHQIQTQILQPIHISSEEQNNNNNTSTPILSNEENLPRIGNSETREVRVQTQKKFSSYFQFFLSLFNPFNDIQENEDFFEHKN